MKCWTKIALCVVLSFMCLFTCVGYAGFTSDLKVVGQAEVQPPKMIFITSITNVVTDNVTVVTSPTNIGEPSTLVLSEITFGGRNAYISFDVTIKNGTEIDQYFDILQEYPSLEGVDGTFSYTNVDWTVTPGQGTEIKSGEMATFNVKLNYNIKTASQSLKMLHEFDFVLDSKDLTQVVSKGVTDKFADILNGNLQDTIEYEYDGTIYTVTPDQAYDAVMEKMETSSPTGNYIGNLSGADEDDKALLTALFEGALTFNTGNDDVPITVMIKQKEVYEGDTADEELVLFITGDELSESRAYVPVYATVFTKNAEGNWEQVGDILAGEARVIAYDGFEAMLGYGTGSFNTETWRSTEIYYGVAVGNEIEAVIDGYETQNP